jgi:hypothetical protein
MSPSQSSRHDGFRVGVALSESDLRPHRQRIEFSAGIRWAGRTHLFVNVAVLVVKHESDVLIDIPIQAAGKDRLAAAGDAGRCAKLIVEVEGVNRTTGAPDGTDIYACSPLLYEIASFWAPALPLLVATIPFVIVP